MKAASGRYSGQGFDDLFNARSNPKAQALGDGEGRRLPRAEIKQVNQSD
jgi:hypothetical protein